MTKTFATFGLVIGLLNCYVGTGFAQVKQEWAARHEVGTGGASAIAVDVFGNVYVTGPDGCYEDPEVGTCVDHDYVTVKYSPDGNQLWVARYNGPGNGVDEARAIAVDIAGNVYVTGNSWGGLATGIDYATVKYDTNGNELWIARYNGPGNSTDSPSDLALDASGNVYVTGGSYGVDAPSDYATIKYGPGGNEIWLARYDSGLVDVAYSIAVDVFGNVYVTGRSGYIPASWYATVKYDTNGNQLWVARYVGPGPDHGAYAIALDATGNVYVTGRSDGFSVSPPGYSSDYATIKYNPDGNQLWVARYNGPGNQSDVATAIAVDIAGNVYVTGRSSGVASEYDFATVKYSPDGNQLWVARYNGPGSSWDGASSIAVDIAGNVYVTGNSYGLATGSDYATVKYSTDGNELWVARYNGPGSSWDGANAIAVDIAGNVYVTGTSEGIGADPFDYATIKYSQPIGLDNVQVTVQTAPAGLQITVDGTTYMAPRNFTWTAGSSHTIATTTPQGAGGTRNVFANWSDGGAISHTVSPTVNTTHTANFTTQHLLTTGVSPAGSGTIGGNPSSADGYYNSGTSVQLSAVANLGYAFANWSGDVTGSANPVSATMSGPKNVTANFNVVPVSGLRFVPVTPCRVADTRNAPGPFGGPVMASNSTRDFAIPASSCGIPSTALAYSLNVTVVPTTGTLGYLSIWPTGQAQPLFSTLNSLDGRVKANAAIVGAGTAGAVSVFVLNDSHVILDINGYFTLPASAPSGLVFYPVTPCRVMDTRLPIGPLGGPILAGGASRTVPMLSSTCGLPAGAAAYSVNITVVPAGPLGYLSTWPSGTAQPFVSTLNDPTGTVVANAAIVPAGTGGSIDVFVTNQTDLIIDVNGYFAPPTNGGLLFYAATPCRVVDTRNPAGPFGGPALLSQRDFDILTGPCSVPVTTKAYSLNATVVPHGLLGYLTLWPAGQPQPVVSTLNSVDASIVSNAAIVPTTTGAISAFSTDTTDLILGLNGFFAP